ncbi:AraC-type DNA-binding protein [Paracoccus halophilus]|uniref:AraC-type DNA-binding protein n=1 Tax=Paracoccus halophilus TaxID=376733 RepID=A0A099F772_9RHOB|nr:AraC family transcriptional regulator [Paracoccus halophilus]KGJ06515.1 hypothetical protein IT41_02420 [Paracoccus halophilus]SFA37882.1 AraC-type DNA-binding protein [Paracoccus halophilus]
MNDRRIIRIENLVTPRRRAFGILLHLYDLERQGLDAADILRESGLPAAVLSDPDLLLDMNAKRAFVLYLLHHPYRRLTPLEAGLAVGAASDITMFAPISNAAKFAANCLEGLLLFLRFPELVWSDCRVAFCETDDEDIIEFVPETHNDELDPFSVGRDMAATLGFITGFYPDAPPLLSVDIRYDADVTRRNLPEKLQVPIRFGAGRNELRMQKGFWSHRPATASEALFRSQEMRIMRHLPVMRREDTMAHLVLRQLQALEPIASLGAVADQLGITERTLSRRLEQEGTTFSDIQNRVMIDKAKVYLRHGGVSVARISELLGYSEPAAFTRAFRRVTGVSPRAWRAADQPGGTDDDGEGTAA